MALYLILGPMFAGKTTTLISKIEVHILTGKKCVIVRSAVDIRTPSVQTHRDLIYKGEVIKLDSLKNAKDKLLMYDIIGFDEGHFFDGEELFQLVIFLTQSNKTVYIAMLKSDNNRNPFPFIEHFVARATDIFPLKAVCEKCKEYNATNTKRKLNSNLTTFVGGKELYSPSCDKCW